MVPPFLGQARLAAFWLMSRVLFLVWGLGLGCAESPSNQESLRPSVIVISLDTTRAESLGLYGESENVSPTLDQLGQSGVVFERALAPVPLTFPSHATLLSGTDPPRHRIVDNGAFQIPAELPWLPEIMQQSGYQTGAFVSSFVLSKKFGLDRGFEVYDDVETSETGESPRERRGEETMAKALHWIQNTSSPFFAWIHLYDPHYPYEPPKDYQGRFSTPYLDEIHYVDNQIERLIESLKSHSAYENMTFVVTADHGEALGDHGEPTHGLFIYDRMSRVPLMMFGRGISKGERKSETVGLCDVMPTLLAHCDLEIPEAVMGQEILNQTPPDRAYMESRYPSRHFGWSSLFGLQEGSYKYIEAPRPELYDLRDDPDEERNLYQQRPDRAREMEARLAAWQEHGESVLMDSTFSGMDAEVKQGLEMLGYVVSEESHEVDNTEPPSDKDPKDYVEVYDRLNRIPVYASYGRLTEAIAESRWVLRRDPENPQATEYLGLSLSRMGRYEESLEPLSSAIEAKPRDGGLVYRRGVSLFQQSDFQRAWTDFEEAIRLDPAQIECYRYLGVLSESREMPEKAMEFYRQYLTHRQDDALVVVRVRERLKGLEESR